jgi:6-phosphogluconolactonase
VIPQLRECQSVVDQVLEMMTSQLISADPMKLHHVVLTGGGAGLSINNRLTDVAKNIPEETWSNTHFWWGDERFVDSDSPDRNDIGIKSSLGDFFIESNIHRVAAAEQVLSAEVAASDYVRELIEFGSAGVPPKFTFVILGVGPDGHIASLFPGHPQLNSHSIAVPVFDSPKPPPVRVTLSYPTLNNSQCTVLLLAGESKREALAAILNTRGRIDLTPARGIQAAELYAVTDLLVAV